MTISADPLVSVGMPVFNCESTLATAIRSIVNQTYRHWELLVVDDGSTDGSLEIARGFCDPRIRISYDGLHAGISARLNQAAGLSRGAYFARMDGDDVSFPDRLRLQVAYLASNTSADLLATSVVVFRGAGIALGQRLCPSSHADICRRPWGSFPMPHPTWMGRTQWFVNHPYDPQAVRAEDQELLLRTYRRSRFAGLEEPLLGYREEPLRLRSLARGRVSYVKAGLHYFLREHEFSDAMALTLGHGARMVVDAAAIATGLESRLLKHRARPISATRIREWEFVWKLNRSDAWPRSGHAGVRCEAVSSGSHC